MGWPGHERLRNFADNFGVALLTFGSAINRAEFAIKLMDYMVNVAFISLCPYWTLCSQGVTTGDYRGRDFAITE